MDIERFKKISNQKIEAAKKTRAVRNEIKEYEIAKQDYHEGTSKLFKPIIDVEKSIDEKKMN